MTHPYGKKISLTVIESSYGQLDKVTPEFAPIKENFDRPPYIVKRAIRVFLKREYIDYREIVDTILEFYMNHQVAWEIARRAVSFDPDKKPKINGILEEEKTNGVHTDTD